MSFDETEKGREILRLSDEIGEIGARIAAGEQLLLQRIRRFDELEGWGNQGALSCAHWLSWRLGIGLGAAREKVRTAKKLGELPLMDEAFKKGEISYCMVRAMTRVATPSSEATLIELAKHSTGAHMEKICSATRRTLQTVEKKNLDQEEEKRWVRRRGTSDDGYDRIVAQLSSNEAAVVQKAIEAAIKKATKSKAPGKDAKNPLTGAKSDPQLSRADGLMAICEFFLSKLEDESTVPGGCEVVIHVDGAALKGDPATLCCELDDRTPIPPETARRLGCDAAVVEMKTQPDGNVEVSRRTRTIPVGLRRALQARDGGCRFPGCTNRIFVDAHHVKHWADGGPTELSNLALLCRRHHKLVHEGGFKMVLDEKGAVTFWEPGGREVPRSGLSSKRLLPEDGDGQFDEDVERRNAAEEVEDAEAEGSDAEAVGGGGRDLYEELVKEQKAEGLDIGPDTPPVWHGEVCDYNDAIEAVLQARARGEKPVEVEAASAHLRAIEAESPRVEAG